MRFSMGGESHSKNSPTRPLGVLACTCMFHPRIRPHVRFFRTSNRVAVSPTAQHDGSDGTAADMDGTSHARHVPSQDGATHAVEDLSLRLLPGEPESLEWQLSLSGSTV